MHIATADLNVDGYPELYIFLQSLTPQKYGSLIAYSPNKGKSLSQVHIPSIKEQKSPADCYEGQDEMEIVENVLCRRFPIPPAKRNAKGDKMMQIQYKLIEGEAGWVLKAEKVISF